MEIERKWLLSRMPSMNMVKLNNVHSYFVRQLYPSIDPLLRLTEKFDRSTDETKYFLTIKSDGDISREEYEFEVTRTIFDGFYMMILNEDYGIKAVYKDYYKIFLADGTVIELSNVDDKFVYCEIEFDSVEEAKAFDTKRIMDIFNDNNVKDVTYDPYYKMKNYWKVTRLDKKVFLV